MASNRFLRSIVVCLIAACTACSNTYSKAEVAGTYSLPVGDGVDTIELNADGKYIHSFKTKAGRTDRQDGVWSLEELQAGSTVELDNFRPLLQERTQGNGFYLLLVKRSLGNLYLITNIDLNEGYKKTS